MASQSQSKKGIQEPDFLNRDLGHSELIKKLKVVTETLEGYGDEEEQIEQGKAETGNLASSLGEDWLVQHKNKDVRLLVACALADILRIYAPNPPYLEETNAEVIRLFIKILRGFESPDMTTQHPSYSIHFYLLERLSSISIFSIIPELINFKDQLMIELTSAVYSIVGSMPQHSAASKVMEHLTSILCSVIEEMESHDVQLLDLVVGALCQHEKKENLNGYNAMKTVIASCENHFQPFLGRELEKIKAGLQMDSDLAQGDRLSQAVFELSAIAPRVLTQVLPAYMEDLTMEEAGARIKAIKLLGAIFSVGTFSADFSQVFTEFKRRTADKDPDVRRAVVSVCHHLIAKRPELAKALLQDSWVVMGETREAPLCMLVVDGDEAVRSEAVTAVLDLCQHNSDSVPTSFLHHVAERTMDKKAQVRHAAIQGLARLWHAYCAPFDRSEHTKAQLDKFGWIPNKVLSLVNVSQESKAFVAHCIEDTCLAPQGDRSTAEIAVDFYAGLDGKGREHLDTLLRSRVQVQEALVKLCRLRNEASLDIEDDGPSADQTEAQLLTRISAAFLEPAKAQEQLLKLGQLKVAKLWDILEGLVTKPRDAAGTKKVQEDLLKRVGPRSPLLECVKTLVRRVVDPCFGLDFVRHVLQRMVEDDEEERGKAKAGLPLVAQISGYNQKLFASEEKALENLVLNHAESKDVGAHVTKVLACTADTLPKLKGSRVLLKRLQELALSEAWVVAKHAVRSVVVLGEKKHLTDLTKEALSSLSFSNQLPSVLRVLAEVAAGQPELLVEPHEQVVKFVIKRLLQGAWPQSAGKKDRNVVQDSKVQGMKLLAALLVHVDLPVAMQTSMAEVFTSTIQQGGELAKEQGTTKADKALLRLTAGSCILKMTKGSPALCSAEAFASAARLCEDEDAKTQGSFMFKIYKGTARQAGKLPFQFATMLAVVAHDADGAVVEKAKFYLRNVFALMLKLRKQTPKAPVALLHERLLPYMLYILAVHPSFLDPDDSSSQVGLAFKKYLDLYFGALTQLPAEEQHCSAQLQVLDHVRSCRVPSEAAGDADPKTVQRNLGLLVEIAQRILLKAGGSKKGAAGLQTAKLVDPSIFREAQVASPPPAARASLGPLSPAGKGSATSTPASKKAAPGSKGKGKKAAVEAVEAVASDSEDDGEPCLVCGSSKDAENTILCDGCDGAYHTQCVGLDEIPKGKWFCSKCMDKGKKGVDKAAKAAEEKDRAEAKKREEKEAAAAKKAAAKIEAEERAKEKREQQEAKKAEAAAKKAAAKKGVGHGAGDSEPQAEGGTRKSKRAARNLDDFDFDAADADGEAGKEEEEEKEEEEKEEEEVRPAKQARKSGPKKAQPAPDPEPEEEPEREEDDEAQEAVPEPEPDAEEGPEAEAEGTAGEEGGREEEEVEEVDDGEPCKVCGSSKDAENTILCDGCDGAYHTYCVGLDEVPTQSWFCAECLMQAGKTAARKSSAIARNSPTTSQKSPAASKKSPAAARKSPKSPAASARKSQTATPGSIASKNDFDFGLSDDEGDARSEATHSTTPRLSAKKKTASPGSQASSAKAPKRPPKARASSTHEVAAKSSAAFDVALQAARDKGPARRAPAKKRRL